MTDKAKLYRLLGVQRQSTQGTPPVRSGLADQLMAKQSEWDGTLPEDFTPEQVSRVVAMAELLARPDTEESQAQMDWLLFGPRPDDGETSDE